MKATRHLFEITSIDASVASPQKLGTTITLDGTVNNVGYPYPHGGYTFNFSITKGGVETASQYNMATATKTMEYVIEDDNANTTTIYYNNSSWSQAYIHYKVGNGSWDSKNGANYSVGSGSYAISSGSVSKLK